jgi:hypothetical protein
MHREVAQAVLPNTGLAHTIERWPEITRLLADTPRVKRKRAGILS